VANQNPGAARLGGAAGIGAQLLAAGVNPIQAIRSLPSLAASIPSAIRALPTAAGLQAIARAAPGGALAGLGLSDADIPLARGEFGAAAKQGLHDAAVGAAVSGAVGLLGHGAEQRVQRAMAAEAARREPVEANIATEQAASRAVGANKAAAAENAAAKEKFRADVVAARAEAARQTEELRRAAAARAGAATEDRSLETLGLDTARGRAMLGGPLRAAEEAPRIARTPVPDGTGQTYGDLAVALQDDPVALGKALQANRRAIGERIGEVRRTLAGTPAKVSAGPILQRLDEELAQSAAPRETRVAAAAAVRDIIERARGPKDVGVQILDAAGRPFRSAGAADSLSAAQLRKVIEDLDDELGFGAAGGNLQKTLGDRADGVLLAARDAATNAEKGLVAAYAPDQLAGYLDDIAAYRTARVAEQGALTKITRPEGRAIRRPAPEKIAPVRPAPVPRPTMRGKVEVPKVSAEARAAEREALAPPKSLGAKIAKGLAGAAGFAAGGVLGHPMLGASAANATADRFLRNVRSTRSELLADSAKIRAALVKHADLVEAGARGGPRVATAIHRELFRTDPAYREAFKEKGRRGAPQTFSEFSAAWKARRGQR